MYTVAACSEMIIYFLNRKTEQYKQVGGSRSVFGGLRFERPQNFISHYCNNFLLCTQGHRCFI